MNRHFTCDIAGLQRCRGRWRLHSNHCEQILLRLMRQVHAFELERRHAGDAVDLVSNVPYDGNVHSSTSSMLWSLYLRLSMCEQVITLVMFIVIGILGGLVALHFHAQKEVPSHDVVIAVSHAHEQQHRGSHSSPLVGPLIRPIVATPPMARRSTTASLPRVSMGLTVISCISCVVSVVHRSLRTVYYLPIPCRVSFDVSPGAHRYEASKAPDQRPEEKGGRKSLKEAAEDGQAGRVSRALVPGLGTLQLQHNYLMFSQTHKTKLIPTPNLKS